MTRSTMQSGSLWPLLIVLTLMGCEQTEAPNADATVTGSGLDQIVDTMGKDALSAEIRRIKDLLADDRQTDAALAFQHLNQTRPSLPADRWIEIDRLEAVVFDAR